MRGLGYGEFLRYLATLRRFVASRAGRCDVVLEKSWLLSGWLSLLAERHGMLGVAVENVVPSPRRHAGAGVMKQLRVVAGRWWAGRCLRRSRLVVAETAQLRADIVRVWGVPAERVAVVGLGVDRGLFHPIEQAEARAALGVRAERTVLVYVGLLDETHDLGPAVEAVAALDRDELELRIVGDGPARPALVARAGGSPRVVFCGRVPHGEVPRHIAVADLCLAPYDSRAFAGGSLGYSTMKIPEYLSVGRPVVAAPSARARELIEDQVTGFLLPNEPESWRRLLATLPPRERLAAMGRRALERPLPSWEDTAAGYMAAIERALAERERR
jgi:glycosyltransferase involved in cell wall biosynthesis